MTQLFLHPSYFLLLVALVGPSHASFLGCPNGTRANGDGHGQCLGGFFVLDLGMLLLREPFLELNDLLGNDVAPSFRLSGRNWGTCRNGHKVRVDGGNSPRRALDARSFVFRRHDRNGTRHHERLPDGAAGAVARRENGNGLRRAGGALHGEWGRGVIPDLGFAVAPADGDGDAGLLIEGGAQVGAVDLGDGAGAADGRRDFAVAVFDLVAENVSVAIDQAIGTGR